MFSNIEYRSNFQNMLSKDLLELPANLAKVSHPSVVRKCCRILNIFYSWITWCFNTIRPTCCIFLSFPCFFFLGQSSENTSLNRLRLSKKYVISKMLDKSFKGDLQSQIHTIDAASNTTYQLASYKPFRSVFMHYTRILFQCN